MAAGVSDSLHDMEWIVGLVAARAPTPGARAVQEARLSGLWLTVVSVVVPVTDPVRNHHSPSQNDATTHDQ